MPHCKNHIRNEKQHHGAVFFVQYINQYDIDISVKNRILTFHFPEGCAVWRKFGTSTEVVIFACDEVDCHSTTGIKVSSVRSIAGIDGDKDTFVIDLTLEDALVVG